MSKERERGRERQRHRDTERQRKLGLEYNNMPERLSKIRAIKLGFRSQIESA